MKLEEPVSEADIVEIRNQYPSEHMNHLQVLEYNR